MATTAEKKKQLAALQAAVSQNLPASQSSSSTTSSWNRLRQQTTNDTTKTTGDTSSTKSGTLFDSAAAKRSSATASNRRQTASQTRQANAGSLRSSYSQRDDAKSGGETGDATRAKNTAAVSGDTTAAAKASAKERAINRQQNMGENRTKYGAEHPETTGGDTAQIARWQNSASLQDSYLKQAAEKVVSDAKALPSRLKNITSAAAHNVAGAYTQAETTLAAGARQNGTSAIQETYSDAYESYAKAQAAYQSIVDAYEAGDRTISQAEYQEAKESVNNLKVYTDAYKSASEANDISTWGEAYSLADSEMQKSAAATEKAKESTGVVGSFLVDASVAGAEMLADAAVGVATGGSSMGAMLVRSFGSGAYEAAQNGGSVGEQLYQGTKQAAIEYLTEKLFGDNPIYDSEDGIVTSLIVKAADKVGNSTQVKKALSSIPVKMFNEGLEEVLSDVLNPLADAAANWIDSGARSAEMPDVNTLLYDGAIGAALGGLGNAAEAVKTASAKTKTAAQTEAAKAEASAAFDAVKALLGESQPSVAKSASLDEQTEALINSVVLSVGEPAGSTSTAFDPVRSLMGLSQDAPLPSEMTQTAAALNTAANTPTPGNETPGLAYTFIDTADKTAQENAISAAYDKVMNSGNSVEIPAETITKYTGIEAQHATLSEKAKALRDAAKEFYNNYLLGKRVSVDLNGGVLEIQFENDGKKKSVGWRMKADKASTFEQLLKLTENSQYAYSQDNVNVTERTSIPRFHYYVADAVMGGSHIPVKIQVRDVNVSAGVQETHYYTHNLQQKRTVQEPVAGVSSNIDSNESTPFYAEPDARTPKAETAPGKPVQSTGSTGNIDPARFAGNSTGGNGNISIASVNSIPTSAQNVNPVTSQNGDGLGAANAGFDPLSRWQMEASQYHPVNEAAAAEMSDYRGRAVFDMPIRDMNGGLTSKQASTLANAKITTNEMAAVLENEARKGTFSHLAYADEDAAAKAERKLTYNGWEQSFGEYQAAILSGTTSKDITALGIALYNNAVNTGKLANAMDVAALMVKNSTNVAQSLQAMNMINKANPDCQMYVAVRGLEYLQRQVEERYGDRGITIEIDQDLLDAYQDALRSQDQARIDKAWNDVEQNIADQIPATFAEKLDAWRYLAMLGNPRTHVRNIAGNTGFIIPRMVKDTLATTMECAATALTGGEFQRTKAFLNPASRADRALFTAAWDYFATVEDAIQSGGKYDDRLTDGIEEKRTIFRRLAGLEAVNNFNKKALDAEDTWFSQPAFSQALASYLKANRITADQFRSNPTQYEGAINYAVKEAQKATYRDTNAFSQFVQDLGHTRSEIWNNYIYGSLLPFKKTPANVLARAVEYSPIGLVKGTYDALFQVKNGNVTAAEAIDEISAGLSGCVLVGLGVLLASKGVLSGGDDDDEKQSAFAKLMGYQNYALNIGGKSFTIDWLVPAAMPLFVGVELYNTFSAEAPASEILSSLGRLAEPMLEMSMLSGLSDLVEDMQNSDVLWGGLCSLTVNRLSQYIPTIFGQLERTIETRREETYRYSTDGISSLLGSDAQYTLGKLGNKLPGLEYNQIPYLDAWGQEQSSGGTITRALNNFLNPSYVSTLQTTAVNTELQRLYDATSGEYNVFPSRPSQSTKFSELNGEYMTKEEYVQYSKTKGQTSLQLVNSLISSDVYASLSDADKASAIQDIYSYAAAVAKEELLTARGIDFDPSYTKLSKVNDIASAFALKEATGTLADSSGTDSAGFEAAYAWLKTQSASQQEALIEAVDGLRKLSACVDAGVSTEDYYTAKAYHDDLNDQDLTGTQKATQFAYWVDTQGYTTAQKTALKNNLTFGVTTLANSESYDALTGSGLSASKASTTFDAVAALTNESGYTSVRNVQKVEAITSQKNLSEKEKLEALSVYASESSYNYYQAAYDYGIPLDTWTKVQRYIADDLEGNVSQTGVVMAMYDAGLTTEQAVNMYDVYAYYHNWTKSYYEAYNKINWGG